MTTIKNDKSKPRKLIVNADDFGLTEGTNQGILKSILKGITTSTTLMMNMPATDSALALAKAHHLDCVGIHLTLTAGKPLLEPHLVATLVDENGNFRKYHDVAFKPDPNELKAELTAQIEAFLESGLKMSHMDSHHHVHMRKDVLPTVEALALAYGVPLRRAGESMRAPSTDQFEAGFFGEDVTAVRFQELVETGFSKGDVITLEMMVHPSEMDEALGACSSYVAPRLRELEVLMDPKLKLWLEDQVIDLVGYGVLL